MTLWFLLFLSTSVLFVSLAVVWWRAQEEAGRKKLLDNIRGGKAADTTVADAALTEIPVPARSGLAGLFGSSKADAVTGAVGANGGFLATTAALAVLGFLIGVRLDGLMGPAARLIGAGCLGAIPTLLRRRRQKARLFQIEEQFPEALDFLGRSVRAGNALSVALELLVAESGEPLKAEIQKMTREIALGAPMDDALNGLISRIPLVEVRFFAAAVLMQRETGGNLSEVLGKLSLSLRERMRLRGQVKAASGQGRLTATILTILPIATLCVMQMISPGYLNGMTGEPEGRNLLACAAVSQIVGYAVMKKIIRIEV